VKPIRILIIDDQYAQKGMLRSSLIDNTSITEAGAQEVAPSLIEAFFCSGQSVIGNVVKNDYGVIVNAIAQGWGKDTACQWSLVLLDVRFDSGVLDKAGNPRGKPEDDAFGLSVREWLRRDFPDLPVAMFSSKQQKEIDNLHEHYLSKDGINERELKRALLDYGQLSLEQVRHLLELWQDIIFSSQEMQAVYRDGYIHAASTGPILILGESGSGKEVLAKYIHRMSPCNDGPFEAINMTAIPENLVEAELFGYDKGAFTGATKAMKGRFETADKGMLFLDEIGDMPLLMQSKVLRTIQEGKIRRVGGEKDLSVDVRLISATHRNIEDQVSTKAFREDLFHRINRVTIVIPPLRERRVDIVPLAQALLEKAMTACNKKGISFSESAKSKLEKYDFPGNVRELENMIERLVVETGNHRVISEEDIKFPAPPNFTAKTFGQEASATQALHSTVQDAADTALLPSAHQIARPVVTLANLHEVIATLPVEQNDPALRGVKPRLEQALSALMRRCAGAALERCKDPMKGEYRRQPAMQLLTGDENLKGKGPERMLNEVLGKNQSDPVSAEQVHQFVVNITDENTGGDK
jgi:DNA-binding NtrC family response regulator